MGRYCLSLKPDFLLKAFQLKLLFLNGADEPICRAGIEVQTYRMDSCGRTEREDY